MSSKFQCVLLQVKTAEQHSQRRQEKDKTMKLRRKRTEQDKTLSIDRSRKKNKKVGEEHEKSNTLEP